MAKKTKEKDATETKELSSFDQLIAKIHTVYGNKTSRTGTELKKEGKPPRITTGNPRLDLDLGGGIVPGRVNLMYGKESSGKTFAVLKCLATHTQRKERVAFLDVERTFDPLWAEACGVDLDYCHVFLAPYAEKYMDIGHVAVASGEFAAVCVDSMAALLPLAMMGASIEKAHMGLEAKAQAEFYRKILSGQHEAYCTNKQVATLYLINQTREKIGIMFGNPETLPGGNAQYFYSSTIMKITKKGIIFKKEEIEGGKSREVPVGQDIEYYIRKNKTSQAFITNQIAMYTSDFAGIKAGSWDAVGSIISLAKDLNIIEVAGKWFKGPVGFKADGYAALWNMLKDDPEMCGEIYAKVHKYYKDNKNIDLAFNVTELF